MTEHTDPATAPAADHPDLDGLAQAALRVADRLHDGATLWCLAPAAPHHARHLAVEFVHPVIIGKRAFPAVAIDGPAPVAHLRAQARPGDVLVMVGDPDDAVCADAALRARAWGLVRLWISPSGPPRAGLADLTLWWDSPSIDGSVTAAVVRTYHLLWELTHVCLEHPGLLAGGARESPPPGDRCVTCADDAVVVEVVSPIGADEALVRGPDGTQTIDVSLVGPVLGDDLLLAHGGTAISRLLPDPVEARR